MTTYPDRSAVDVRVVDTASGRVLWQGRVARGGAVEVRYIHSVERTPVVERFRAEAVGMRLVEMRFASQGAGLPNEGFVREGDEFVLRTDRLLPALPLRVSAVAGHRLHLRDEAVDLVTLAGDGAAVAIEARGRAWPRWPLSR